MKFALILTVSLLLVGCSQQETSEQPATAKPSVVRVLSDRTETHLKPLFDLFKQNSGIKVEAVYADKGMLSRLQTQPTEADLIISSTAEIMEIARKEGLLKPFDASVVEGVSDSFVDPDRMYAITSYRPRSIFYSRERVKPEELSTYMTLTDPKWKGRVSIRSGYHPYNMSLLCQMMEAYGPDKTKAFLAGLKANLARKPQGNDRAQVEAIYNGIADVSIGNSYYMPLMLERDDQRAWGEATEVFFPNQKEEGAFVMRSAAGLTTADRNVAGASKLLAFLFSDLAQSYFAKTLHVYPVKDGIPTTEATKSLAKNQEGIKDGQFKAHFIPIRDAVQHREAVVKILNELNFDD